MKIIKDKRGIVTCSDNPSLLYQNTIIVLTLGLLVGFILGSVLQQAHFIKGAVEIIEGLEGTTFNIEVDINETQLIKGLKEEFIPILNQTLQENMKETKNIK